MIFHEGMPVQYKIGMVLKTKDDKYYVVGNCNFWEYHSSIGTVGCGCCSYDIKNIVGWHPGLSDLFRGDELA